MQADIQDKLCSILETVTVTEGTKMGNIQYFDSAEDCLMIIAHKGFKKDFLKHFKYVKAFGACVCGRAYGIGNTVFVEDLEDDIVFAPHLEMARKAGFRAVKSVPIICCKKERLGVISTHFPEPKNDWNTEVIKRIMPELSQVLKEYKKIQLEQECQNENTEYRNRI